MKKKIILRCWLVSLLTALLVLVSVFAITYGVSARNVRNNLSYETDVYIKLLDEDFDGTITALENVVRWNVRLTVFDIEGNPLFESDASLGSLDNHLDRPEIQGALNGKPTYTQRYSKTFGCNMMYYAKLTTDGQHIVRLAMPTSSVSSVIVSSIAPVLVTLVLALFVSYLLANRTGKQVASRMQSICDSLHSLNSGNYKPIKASMNDGESFAVLSEINDLFVRLDSQYKQSDFERTQSQFILNSISQGVVAFNSESKVEFINNSAVNMLGRGQVGMPYVILLDSPDLCEFYQKAMNGGGTAEFQCNGKQIAFSLTLTDGALSDRMPYLLILSDVTAEKQWIKQKNSFFSNASHELKTPLTTIQGLAESLIAQDVDQQTAKYLQRIYTESVRMNSLVMDMLYIDRLESEAKSDNCENVHISEILSDVMSEYEKRIKDKNITVTVNGDIAVKADYRDMSELVGNIFGNAVNYNVKDGSIKVDMHTDKEGRAVLTVTDSGIGITSQHLPRICERFYRVDKGRSNKTGGTGLGLSIVKHICIRYNAVLDIKSQETKGTTVTVTFPKS